MPTCSNRCRLLWIALPVGKLIATIDAGGLPKLVDHFNFISGNPMTAAAGQAVLGALAKRSQ